MLFYWNVSVVAGFLGDLEGEQVLVAASPRSWPSSMYFLRSQELAACVTLFPWAYYFIILFYFDFLPIINLRV